MQFSFIFLRAFMADLVHAGPPLIALASLIILIGYFIGRLENWSIWDSIYHAFINATSVGYGDFRPTMKLTKFLAIMLAFVGIIYTGLIVALAVHAAQVTFLQINGSDGIPIL